MIARLALVLSIVVLIASPANAQWHSDGLVLGGGGYPHVISDGSGGAFLTWWNWDPWMLQWELAMGQRLSVTGSRQWSPNGQLLCGAYREHTPTLITDGAGGAIFVWTDDRNSHHDIFAQRLNASGVEQWPHCGLPVRLGDASITGGLAAVPDGSGGVIVAWGEPQGETNDIYAQRVNPGVIASATPGGVPVCTAAQSQMNLVAVSDGSGGAWFSWVDYRNGSSNPDIYARHLDANGVPQGPADGLAVCDATGLQTDVTIAPDGAGGVIVAWTDRRVPGNGDVFAQHVSAAGTMQWTTNGISLCSFPSTQEQPQIAPDGSGGAVVVWNDLRAYPAKLEAYAQRVNGAGATQWVADGVLLGHSDQSLLETEIISDGNGESIVIWSSLEWNPGLQQFDGLLRAQRLGAGGLAQWNANGVEVLHLTSGNGASVAALSLASDGWGGAIVTWQDWRYWQASDVRAAHVSPGGAVTDIAPTRGPSLMAVDVYPNPFAGATSLAIELRQPSALNIDVFDVAGRRVRSVQRAVGDLSHVVELTDRDDAGQSLASGVYFVRVRAAGETVTRKMVITR